jgi:hypothetical protein
MRLGVALLVALALALPLVKPVSSIVLVRRENGEGAAALARMPLHQQHTVVLRHDVGAPRVALRTKDILRLAIRWNVVAVLSVLCAAAAVAFNRRRADSSLLPRSVARGAPLAPRAPPAIAI